MGDPHPGWLSERNLIAESIREARTDNELHNLGTKLDELDDQLFRTPPDTFAGLHAQLCALCRISDPADAAHAGLLLLRDHVARLDRTKYT